MNGTYELKLSHSLTDFETLDLVLFEENGILRGAILELMYRMHIFEDGKLTDGGFLFSVPATITLFGDISMELSGKVEGDMIFGDLVSTMGTFSYNGTRISDSVMPLA